MSPIFLLILGLASTILLTKITIQIANQNQLFDATDYRKVHKETVSALGGIPIFIGCWVMTICSSFSFQEYLPLFVATGLLFLVGIMDDLKSVPILKRLFVQILAGTIAFMGGYHLGWEVPILNYSVTILFIIVLINSFNFIDGINGLAGSLGVIAMLVFGILLSAFQLPQLAFLAIGYGVALCGFLVFNFGKKASIFMGDNGSTILGFLVGVFALKTGQVVPSPLLSTTLPLVIIVLMIPVLDLFYVAIARMVKGNSPFKGDRNHIHHILTDSNMSHPGACVFIGSWIGSLFLLVALFPTLSFMGMLFLLTGSYVMVRLVFSKSAFEFRHLIWKVTNRIASVLL